ncbi:MAG: hypothetical protein IJ376_00135 [Acidaminococcaceae bacterium]|nr:hypothetical protein [Acidaminococcaceae bacterium]
MKKVLRYLILTVMTLCFSLPCFSAVEAATVAILPLINNVEGGDDLANQVFYKEAINTLKYQKGFVMVENDKLNVAIDAAMITDDVPNKAALARIAQDGDVDIVFCMELDDLELKNARRVGEMRYLLDMEGEAVAYNALTGAFYKHEFSSDKEVDAALTARGSWKHDEFARQVRRELKKALNAK